MNGYTEKLCVYLERENFAAFAADIHYGLETEDISLADLSDVLAALHEQYLYYDYDEDSEEYQYISHVDIIPCAVYFLFMELTRLLRVGRITLSGSVLTGNSGQLDLEVLQNTLTAQAAVYGEESDFVPQIRDLISRENPETPLQAALLDAFSRAHGGLIMVMVYYLRHQQTVEDLKSAQNFHIGQYTKEEFTEIHAKKTFTTYCYFFLEQSSSDESRQMNIARKQMKEAETADDFILAVSHGDIWLRTWFDGRPMFPHSTYLLLTDSTFHTAFLDESAIDPEVWCEEDAADPEIAQLLCAAKSGDAQAQDKLGALYLVGKNVKKNERKAVYWIKKAAEQGIATAQTNYGVALQNGLGGAPRNFEEAILWFRKAAEQGQPDAQYNLGLAYSARKGVPRNPEEADKWFRLAAENGHIMAKLVLENGLIIRE